MYTIIFLYYIILYCKIQRRHISKMYMYIYVLFFEFAVSRALLVVETQAFNQTFLFKTFNKPPNNSGSQTLFWKNCVIKHTTNPGLVYIDSFVVRYYLLKVNFYMYNSLIECLCPKKKLYQHIIMKKQLLISINSQIKVCYSKLARITVPYR